jgi:hypothetical protein
MENKIFNCKFHDGLSGKRCWECEDSHVLNNAETVCNFEETLPMKNCRKYTMGSYDTCDECKLGYYQIRADNRYCASFREDRQQVSQIAVQVKKRNAVKAFILHAQHVYPTESELKFKAAYYYSNSKVVDKVYYRFRVTNGTKTETKCDVGDPGTTVDALCSADGDELTLSKDLLRREKGYRLTVQVRLVVERKGEHPLSGTSFEINDIYEHIFDVREYTSYNELEELDFWPKDLTANAKRLPYADVEFMPVVTRRHINANPIFHLRVFEQTFER